MRAFSASIFVLCLAACGTPMVPATGAGISAAAEVSTPGAAAPASDEIVVKAAPFEEVFPLSGELTALRALNLDTPRSDTWRVQVKWLAEDGTEAKTGDRLIEFDNTSITAGLEEKRLAWIQSEIDMEGRSAQLDGEEVDLRSALDRARHEQEKASLQAAIPAELSKRSEWEERQAALRRADAEVEKARLALDAFQTTSKSDLEVLRIARDKAARDIADSERRLEAFTVRAPRDGIFIVEENWNEDRKFQSGDTSWPGMSVGSMPDLSAMEVTAFLSDVDDGKVMAGMPARCILDTYPDRIFEGKVESVAAIAERNGFRVRISLQGSDPKRMRPGMSVRAEIVRKAWPSALVVPRKAVRKDGDRRLVATADRGEPVEVQLAGCTPTDCVVASGLAEGDRIVVRQD